MLTSLKSTEKIYGIHASLCSLQLLCIKWQHHARKKTVWWGEGWALLVFELLAHLITFRVSRHQNFLMLLHIKVCCFAVVCKFLVLHIQFKEEGFLNPAHCVLISQHSSYMESKLTSYAVWNCGEYVLKVKQVLRASIIIPSNTEFEAKLKSVEV